MKILAERLKQLRAEKDLSMEELVADMNNRFHPEKPLNRSMVSRWESGDNDPTLEKAKLLSEYFDVSLDYLIGLSDIRTPSRVLTMKKKGEKNDY